MKPQLLPSPTLYLKEAVGPSLRQLRATLSARVPRRRGGRVMSGDVSPRHSQRARSHPSRRRAASGTGTPVPMTRDPPTAPTRRARSSFLAAGKRRGPCLPRRHDLRRRAAVGQPQQRQEQRRSSCPCREAERRCSGRGPP